MRTGGERNKPWARWTVLRPLEGETGTPSVSLVVDDTWVNQNVEWRSKSDIVGQSENLFRWIAFRNLDESSFDGRLPCVNLNCLFDIEQKIAIPMALFSPSYPVSVMQETEYVSPGTTATEPGMIPDDTIENYRLLHHAQKYSSSNGAASGATLAEARLHAICELIERDAESIFYLKAFSVGRPDTFALVDKKTIEPRQSVIWQSVEEAIETEIIVIDLTTDIQVPVYGAYGLSGRDFRGLAWAGHGCSINSAYALERALLELKQCYDIDPMLDSYWSKSSEPPLADYTGFFRRAYYFDPVSLRNNDRVAIRPIESITIEESLSKILTRFEELGQPIYAFDQLMIPDSEIWVSKLIAPGLEDLLPSFHYKLPSYRGLTLINGEKGA